MDTQEAEIYLSEDEDSVCDSDTESDEVEVEDLCTSEKKNKFTISDILGLDKSEQNKNLNLNINSNKSNEPVKPIAISPASICGTCELNIFINN